MADLESITLLQAEVTLALTVIGGIATIFSKKVRSIIFAPFIWLHKTFSNKSMEIKFDAIMEQLQMEDGTSLRQSVVDLGKELQDFSVAYHERTNHFESMQQSLSTLSVDMTSLRTSMDAKQNAIISKFTAMLDQPSTPPMFETDAEGKCTWASTSYLQMTGRPIAEVLDWGWTNAIHPDDLEKVRDEWHLAVKQHRVFEYTYRFQHTDGTAIKVKCRATPYMHEGIVSGWMGMVTILPRRAPRSNVELIITG